VLKRLWRRVVGRNEKTEGSAVPPGLDLYCVPVPRIRVGKNRRTILG